MNIWQLDWITELHQGITGRVKYPKKYLNGASLKNLQREIGISSGIGLSALYWDKKFVLNKPLLKKGNHKLPESIPIWVLPEVKTCPGRTVDCELACFAKKAEIQYGEHITDSRSANFKISQSKHFVKLINSQIKGFRMPPEAIRIHEAGDFYNQEYLDKWKLIAYQNPVIIFWAYTRSYMLDFKERSKNFVVFYSIDTSTKHSAPEGVDNVADMCDGELFADLESKFCWRWNLNKGGSCRECNYCYDGKDEKKHVTFFKHR